MGFNREISRSVRGAAAGTGVFKSLGRSLAFASGGFIAAAGITDLLRGSIEQASEAAATQKQLAAQFRASGQNLAAYRDQIDRSTQAVSRLAGFEDDELTKAFTTAFRGSQNVAVALRIQATAADVARGRHLSLEQSTLALTKAYGGQATALRRLGVLIPTQLHGLAALNFVQAKFAGQAAAGTTAQEKFSAAFKNFEEVVGVALLPSFNKILSSAAKWLDSTKNQKKVQGDLNAVTKSTGGILHNTSQSLHNIHGNLLIVAHGWEAVQNAVGGATKAIEKYLVKVNSATPQPGSPEQVRLLGLANAVSGGGEDVRLRGAAAGAFTQLANAPGTSQQRASLNYQLSLLQEKLAKAELTAGLKDDRAVLVRLAALTQQKLSKTKELGARIQLEQSLGSVEQQIAAIDAKGAADQKLAHDKQIAARKKEAAEAKAQQAKLVAIAKQQAASVTTATQNMRQAFQTSLGTVQGVIGTIFQGPTLAGETQAQHLAAAGVPGTTAKGLTGDVVAQTAQARRFYNDLTKLKKLGASKGLLSALTAQGESAMPQIETLIKNPAQAKAFIKAFGAQEKFAARIAAMNVTANRVTISAKDRQPVVVYLTLDGKVVSKVVTTHQHRTRRNSAPGARGTGQEIGSWAFQ